jgi:predicted nucleic acid-binding Zn ribbon protein
VLVAERVLLRDVVDLPRPHGRVHEVHPVRLSEVGVVVMLRVPQEARVGAIQQLRGEVRVVAQNQHRQVGVRTVEAGVRLDHWDAAHQQGLPQPIRVEAQPCAENSSVSASYVYFSMV